MSESLCSFSRAAHGAYSRDAGGPAPCSAGPAIPPGSLQDVGERKGSPTSFVRLPVSGGHETLVDPDIAAALGGQRLCLVGGRYAGFKRHNRAVFVHHCVVGRPLSADVDHINRDRLDNRRCNLRIVSRSANLVNAQARRASASTFRGVYRSHRAQRWYTSFAWYGRLFRSATLRHAVLAAFARDDLVQRVTGARYGLNFPWWLRRSEADAVLRAPRGGPVTVWFVKRSDGSIRRMVCRSAEGVPAARRARDAALRLVTVTELDSGEPRCIPLEGILCLTCNNQSFRVTDAPRAAA